MYNGQVVTTSGPIEYQNSSYKRGRKYLLKAIAGNVEGLQNPGGKESLIDFNKQLDVMDYYWRQYYKGNYGEMDLTQANSTFWKMVDPTSKGSAGKITIHPKARSFLNNYTDIKWHYPVNEVNPYGMGPKYNNSMSFLRALYEGTTKESSFKEFEKGFSYIHQVMAENGHMDPMVHMAVMRDISKRLGPHVLENAFPSQVNIANGSIDPVYNPATQKNPFFAFLGSGKLNGSSGINITFDNGATNSQINYRQKFIKQSQGIRENAKYDFRKFKEELKTSVKKGDKNYKGEKC